ncbi:MAG TPA: ABC transporter permease subunit [Symbiobacteriaceae bacterium]|nr:ABC transporter permease subunit [Symbiobacteriaceae bacterium]
MAILKVIWKRLLLFLSISAFAIAVIFLRAGLVTSRAYLPDFAWNRYWPALTQYVSHLLHGTFGYIYQQPPVKGGAPQLIPTRALVSDVLLPALPVSLTLFFSALIVGVLLGLVAGLLSSRFTRPGVRRTVSGLNLLLLSLPDLLVIFFVQFGLMKLSRITGWALLPPYGNWQGGLTLRTAILPVLMLSLFPAAYVARISAAAFDSVFGADFIRTARAKGVAAWKITWGHGLRNAVVPILAAVPVVTGIMISNLVIVEYTMNIVGVGRLMAWQIATRQQVAIVQVTYPSPNIIASVALCLAALFVVVGAVGDLLLLMVDPRARTARQEAENEAAIAQMDRAPLRERLADLGHMLAEFVRGLRDIRLPDRAAWRRLGLAYRGNLPLILGTLIVGVLILIALLAPVLAPSDPYKQNPILIQPRGYQAAPFAPGTPGFPLGSDNIGRDLLSRVIFGTRYTLLIALLIVPLRMMIAVPLGLAAGWMRGRWEWFVTRAAVVLGAVPAMMLQALLLLAIFPPPLPQTRGNPNAPQPNAVLVLLLHASILVLFGWPRMAETVRLMAREIANRPFVEGARAVGAGPSRMVFRHILPHLWPSLAVAAAAEAAWVMMLLVQLGAFGIWLGGSTAMEDYGLVARFPDWSQMLAFPVTTLWSMPWALLVPAVAFVTAIFGFNLLAEGIRRAQQRYSA